MMKKETNVQPSHVSQHSSNEMLAAVVIRVKDGESTIAKCSKEYKKLMDSRHPDDNFDNVEIIPESDGNYQFDIEYGGGSSFNGESTEYEYWCRLMNCRRLQ